MRRLIITFLVACLIGIGAAPAVLAQSPFPGPPYPDPIDGVGVYDYAGVLGDDTISEVEATIRAIEERSGAEVVVLTQVKSESDTVEEAERDAIALMDQWDVGRPGIDDGLAILFDLEPNLCHGQVLLRAGPGYAAVYLTNAERQAIFEGDMRPALRECDIDAALLAAMERIDAATRPDIPAGADRRVEMPEAGIALTFPGDWTTHEPTPQEAESLLSEVKLGYRSLLRTALVADAPDQNEMCLVAEVVGAHTHPPIGVVDGTPVDLPAGQAWHIDLAHWAGSSISAYTFTDGSTWFAVLCGSPVPRVDHWLSIAETFEFLPEEN